LIWLLPTAVAVRPVETVGAVVSAATAAWVVAVAEVLWVEQLPAASQAP
jgi:hypothetical protein